MKKYVSRDPVNKMASIVTSKGYKYKPRKIIAPTLVHTDVPPPMTGKGPQHLVGVRFGYFEVIGLYAKKKGRWVVRCDCGKYETRTAKAIKNPKNSGDRCHMCRHLEKLKRLDEYRRKGYNTKEHCT